MADCGVAMQLLDDALPVLLLAVRNSRILIIHTKAHGVVEQESNLACGRCNGLDRTTSRRLNPEKREQFFA